MGRRSGDLGLGEAAMKVLKTLEGQKELRKRCRFGVFSSAATWIAYQGQTWVSSGSAGS
jgi:hypothetical protein